MTSHPSVLAARFRHFADVECPGEPLYQALCHLAADDAALLDLLRDTPGRQQRPNLWLAALHERVLAGDAPALAAYFPSVGGRRAADAALATALRATVAEHDAVLRDRMRTQTTQTNEIGRCAVLWPALHAIARRAGHGRIAMLDVGCSAGLNLGVDAYRYTGDGVQSPPEAGHGGPVPPTVTSRRVGAGMPQYVDGLQVVARLGIDPSPIDVDDAAAVGWLRACLWPGDAARAERFDRAVALARVRRWPVRQVADCTAFIADWLDSLPAGVQPVVFNSWVLTYFETDALHRHVQTLRAHVRDAGALWLSAESAAVDVGAPPAPADAGDTASTVWTLTSRGGDGDVRCERLARSHAHGHWVEWLDPAH